MNRAPDKCERSGSQVQLRAIDQVRAAAETPAQPGTVGFEGPEKRLEFEFVRVASTGSGDMRAVSRQEWQTRVLDLARCTILSEMSNQHCTAYVLSESSLFVFKRRVMIKTCGTTALLEALPAVAQLALERGLAMSSVRYSRKNFSFTELQPHPYSSGFESEVRLLEKYLETAGRVARSCSHIAGPYSGDRDRWYVFVAELRHEQASQAAYVACDQHADVEDDESSSGGASLTMEVLMHDLDPDAMRAFWRRDEAGSDDALCVTRATCIDKIVPNSDVDPWLFDPCGYSLNGLCGTLAHSAHVTPETHCSFVSYEIMNLKQEHVQGDDGISHMLRHIVRVFDPSRFTVVLVSDDADLLHDASAALAGEMRRRRRSTDKPAAAHRLVSKHTLDMTCGGEAKHGHTCVASLFYSAVPRAGSAGPSTRPRLPDYGTTAFHAN